jgi:ribosomal-protein-serine acetyltransferase
VRLPERVEGDGVLLRRWRVEDAPAQHRVVLESLEHLRPWMSFVASEPVSLAERESRIAGWAREWELGGDVYLAILVGGEVAGSTGLYRRAGPGGLEIGYWLHPGWTGRGYATAAARALTGAAFGVEGIEFVEISHDRANLASRGVPERLGFTLAREAPNPKPAPADTGIDCVWLMTRGAWTASAG